MNFIVSPATAAVEVAFSPYRQLEMRFDQRDEILWSYMKPQDRPSFTLDLLGEIADMQETIRRLSLAARPFRYFVFGSRTPGIYNLGGDLPYFTECIRAGDAERLREYGYACVGSTYENSIAYGSPLITIGLVQGDALGGGFECALSFDVIIAERSARFGLPEILFNMIPGMGAYSHLSRRLGMHKAEEMITSGRIFTADDLHRMGIVDVVCPDQEGEVAVQQYVMKHSRRHAAELALYHARRRVNGVPLKELRDVVDIWVQAALCLDQTNLRTMTRLASAQKMRMNHSTQS